MKVRDLKSIIERLPDDNELVIRVDRMAGSVGGLPTVEVKGFYNGFDWDRGSTLIEPAETLHVGGEQYASERKAIRDKGEAIAFIWMNVSNKTLSDTEKLRAVRATIKRFGFNVRHSVEAGDDKEGGK